MLAAHPKAGSHFTATGNRADMMGQIANVNRRIAKAYARADDGRLAVIVQPGIGKAKAGGRDKANRAADQIAGDILIHKRGLPDIERAAAGVAGRRIAPPDMDMRLWVPKFILSRGIAVPAEPPINHRRGNAGHVGVHTHPHAAIFGQHKAIFQHRRIPEEILRRLINIRQQQVWHPTSVQRGAHMRRQGGEIGVEKTRIGQCMIRRAIAQIAPRYWLAAFHDTRPIYGLNRPSGSNFARSASSRAKLAGAIKGMGLRPRFSSAS